MPDDVFPIDPANIGRNALLVISGYREITPAAVQRHQAFSDFDLKISRNTRRRIELSAGRAWEFSWRHNNWNGLIVAFKRGVPGYEYMWLPPVKDSNVTLPCIGVLLPAFQGYGSIRPWEIPLWLGGPDRLAVPLFDHPQRPPDGWPFGWGLPLED